MPLLRTAGSHIFIGGPLDDKSTDFVAADFTSQVWTEIDGWQTAGAFGDTAETIRTKLINRNRIIKQKGVPDAGTMQNTFAVIPTDPGQIALLVAADGSNRNSYAFRLDLLVEEGGTDSYKVYFIALAMNASRQGGDADTIQMLQVNLELNSNIVEVIT
jgi:hypothetical protein